jgi:metal-sulfur cluster biosynthetic enzyme
MAWFSKKKIDEAVTDGKAQETIETPEITDALIRKILHPIKDPDLNVSIVDLGLIKEVHIDGNKVHVDMILTSPGCPYGPMLLTMAQRMLELKEYLDEPKVELVMGEYLQLEDLSDEQRLNLGLDF